MKKALITALAITLQISCAMAGVPLRFDADVRSTSTFQASAYRGETLDIRARLLDGAHPLPVPAGAEAAMLWQTNGMGTAWWSVPATVSTSGVVEATWTPTNDVGAAAYRLFLGVADGGANYRANMLLRMIDAPGFAPNSLPLPVQSIDFSLVEVSNAPWLTVEADPVWEAEKGEYATTGALARAVADIDFPAEADPVWNGEKGGYVKTNHIGNIKLRGSVAEGVYTEAGMFAHAEGYDTRASGMAAHAEGDNSKAQGGYSHAGGIHARALHDYSFSWQGVQTSTDYDSHGQGTFNINPAGGPDGVWIGNTNLSQTIRNLAPAPDLSFTNDFARAESLGSVAQAGTNYTEAALDLEHYNAMRRAVYERGLTTNEWHVENISGCEVLDDFHPLYEGAVHVLCFTNISVSKNSESATNSFLIVPDNGLWLTGAALGEWGSMTETDDGGPWHEVSETNGMLRVDVGIIAGDRRIAVDYLKIVVKSAEGVRPGALREQRDDLRIDDYNFTDDLGDTSLAQLRPWATNRYDGVTAPHWSEFPATRAVELAGHTLRFSQEQLASFVCADTYETTNDAVLFMVGMSRALELFDGRGVAGDGGRFRIVGIQATEVLPGITNHDWRVVDVSAPAPVAEFESLTITAADNPRFDGAAVVADATVTDDFYEGEPVLRFRLPKAAGNFFYASGRLRPHPASYVQTAFTFRAEGDVVAHSSSGTVHRLSAKADAAAIPAAVRYALASPEVSTCTTSNANDTAVAALADRAISAIAATAGVERVELTLPPATSGSARDLLVNLAVTAESAPAVVLIDPETSAEAAVDFGAGWQDEIAPGRNLLLLTEVAPARWLITSRHEEVAE